eukprot:4518116-Pleurochrysis_carterae.AAC.1
MTATTVSITRRSLSNCKDRTEPQRIGMGFKGWNAGAARWVFNIPRLPHVVEKLTGLQCCCHICSPPPTRLNELFCVAATQPAQRLSVEFDNASRKNRC